MLLVLLAIALILIIVGNIKGCKDRDYEQGSVLGTLIPGYLIGAITLGFILGFTGMLVNTKTINSKIEYLSENNTVIETKISQAIKDYCDYEGKTYIEVAPDNPAVIFIAYPELKADELFKSYLDTLQANNTEIRKLKLEQLSAKNYKWWLYFG